MLWIRIWMCPHHVMAAHVYQAFCICHKSGHVSVDMSWWFKVIEAVDPTHIHLPSILYIKGVWQPLYAVDVHMDVSTPRYGRSCLQCILNFATDLWASLSWYVMAFISHPCYIYQRCLTNLICCVFAYGCVHTTLWPLMSTKHLDFCHKSGQVSDDMSWWNEVIEAVDPTHIHLPSIL